ncbi:hypothetical protein D3C71_1309170 [compost metagenome]
MLGDIPARVGIPELGHDLPQPGLQVRDRRDVDAHAGAHAPARQIEHIVDEPRHAPAVGAQACAVLHHFQVRTPQHDLADRAHGRQRIAQVMTQHGNELVAQLRVLARVAQGLLGFFLPLLKRQLAPYELRKVLEHADGLGIR